MLRVTKLLLSRFKKILSFRVCFLVPKDCLFSALAFNMVLQGSYDYMVLCKRLFLRYRKNITCIQCLIMTNIVYYSVIILKEPPHKILNKYTQKHEIKLGPKCLRGRDD